MLRRFRVFIRSSYYSLWNHNRRYPSALLSSRERRSNWNSIATNVTRSRKKYAIREMYCKNCRAVTDGTHFNAANPSVIDNRLSDSENQLSPRIVRTTKKRERKREGEFFSIYVWYKPTVPRACPDPFDSRGDQWRTKVTHMQAAHRSWLISDPHGCLPTTHKTQP